MIKILTWKEIPSTLLLLSKNCGLGEKKKERNALLMHSKLLAKNSETAKHVYSKISMPAA